LAAYIFFFAATTYFALPNSSVFENRASRDTAMSDNTLSYTPRETTELVLRAGISKGNMRVDKVFISAVNAGLILSFACATYLTAITSPWFQDNAPGLIKVLGALLFPYGT
jgi:formate/nitrite transporter FocA (FNT family)